MGLARRRALPASFSVRFMGVLRGECYTQRAQRALARSKCTASVACTLPGRFFCVVLVEMQLALLSGTSILHTTGH